MYHKIGCIRHCLTEKKVKFEQKYVKRHAVRHIQYDIYNTTYTVRLIQYDLYSTTYAVRHMQYDLCNTTYVVRLMSMY